MALPNPDYLLLEYFQWNGNTRLSALLGTTATTRTSINWEGMDVYQRPRFHDLVMAYAIHNGETETNALANGYPVAGWQEVDYGGTVVGGNPPGLAAQVYTASVVIDGGVPITLSVDGAAATTFTLVITALNALLGANGTAAITTGDNVGNIEIISDVTGLDTNVVITDVDLFSSMTGYVSMGSTYEGATVMEDILDVNDFLYNPIAEQFTGLLKEIPIKPTLRPSDITNISIYNRNSDGSWRYMWDDTAVTP